MVTLADSAELSFLGDLLADDVEQSIREALDAETVFPAGADPLSIYRATLAESIRDIEHHERGQLLQRFLRDGPQQDRTNVSPEMAAQRLSDEETAKAIAFIFGFMVSSFKGALMELLALGPCVRLMDSLKAEGHLSSSTRLYLGDSVLAARSDRSHFAKGADLHMLSIESVSGKTGQVYVDGLVEVKSYVISQRRILRQLDRHLQRATLGLRVQGEEVDPRQVQIGHSRPDKAVLIAVAPSSWKLPRIPKFEGPDGRRFLRLEAPKPLDDDRIVRTANRHWRITLRWSQEAIASAAYEMTFWYMEKVGEVIFRDGVPPEWPEMTPAEAGRNAVKEMLYHAILRGRTAGEDERAIALYNVYGFGYALGMSFRRSRKGRREMLWPQDIDEVAERGQTANGCRFW